MKKHSIPEKRNSSPASVKADLKLLERVREVQRATEGVVVPCGSDAFIKVRDHICQQEVGSEVLIQLVAAQEVHFPERVSGGQVVRGGPIHHFGRNAIGIVCALNIAQRKSVGQIFDEGNVLHAEFDPPGTFSTGAVDSRR